MLTPQPSYCTKKRVIGGQGGGIANVRVAERGKCQVVLGWGVGGGMGVDTLPQVT